VATEENTEETESASRSQMWIHEAMVEWLEGEGNDLSSMSPAEVIAVAFAKRVAWRKSTTYAELKAAHANDAEKRKAEVLAERAAAKEARDKAKAEKAEAKAAKLAADKAAKAEAAKAEKPAAAAKKTTAKKTAGRKPARSKTTDTSDDPFSE
jgi:membrane protein involved in colicin uptake